MPPAAQQETKASQSNESQESERAQLPAGRGAAVERFLTLLSDVKNPNAIETLKTRVIEVPLRDGYEADPKLPAMGNEIRGRISEADYKSHKYADFQLALHEETHSLNANVGRLEFERIRPELEKIRKKIWDAAQERMMKGRVFAKGETVTIRLTAEESKQLPSDPTTIYVPERGVAVTVLQPKITPKPIGFPRVLGALKTQFVENYLVNNDKINKDPLQLFDEASAYLADSHVCLELARGTDNPSGSDKESRLAVLKRLLTTPGEYAAKVKEERLDFVCSEEIDNCAKMAVSILAHASAVQERESDYFETSGYKEVSAYLVKQLLQRYQTGMQYPVFRAKALVMENPRDPRSKLVERNTEQFYRALVSKEDGANLRDFALQHYGEKWCRETFIDPDVVFRPIKQSADK